MIARMKEPSRASALPDLTICDREPITRLDMIQDFGFLIALANDGTVVRASANLIDHLGVEATVAIGMPFDKIVSPRAAKRIRDCMAAVYANGNDRLFGVRLVDGAALLNVNVHLIGEFLVIEGEPATAGDAGNTTSTVHAMTKRLLDAPSLDDFHRTAAHQVRTMTGFDRVMIYRFDARGNGEVIAESLHSGVESFLGLHYPATDIPQQARALYLANPFRIIADVDSTSVALVPAVSGITDPLDLSQSITRAVSPVHIEYLRNMGVRATLSISIIVDGALWGLIACHHHAPRLAGLAMRTSAELFGTMYSLALGMRLQSDNASEEIRARDLTDRLISAVAGNGDLLSDPQWLQDMMREMIAYDGVAICHAGDVSTSGRVPGVRAIKSLARHLNIASPTRVFTTDRIASIDPAFAAIAERAAGMLAIPISRTPRDYILLFRREQIQTIHWGGDPAKPAATREGQRLSPRQSFAAFAETVRGRSLPFSNSERRTAEAVRTAMVEVILRMSEAHHAAIAASEKQIKVGLTHLLASAAALASASDEAKVDEANLLASAAANEVLTVANSLLLTNEAALEEFVSQQTEALRIETADRRVAESALHEGEKLQAIGQLTGGIAHDFNNILQQIFSATSLLRMPNLSEQRRGGLLDNLDLTAEAARKLTSRLLAFARRQVLKPEAIDVNALVVQMAELLRPSLGATVTLDLDLGAEPCWAMVDPEQLQVAILNLAANARDAMRPGGGTFTLRTGHQTPEGAADGYLYLQVSDTGSGMPPETLSRIFEPFFTTKRAGMGTGLGLSQVWGFAKQSGGDLIARSELGKGTSFAFRLPTPDAAQIAIASRAQGEAIAPNVDASAQVQTIMVVEDNIELADATISLLESQGYATVYAANADQALAMLDTGEPIDAVFSDVVMPGSMNGVELAAEVRTRFPKLAITLASGYSEFLVDRRDEGSAEVLGKPYRVDELTAALDRAFESVAAE